MYDPIIIIGLGLIGGSLAASCRRKFPRSKIIGISRNRAVLTKAKRRGWIHEGFVDLRAAFTEGEVRHASPRPVVILCTPVDTLNSYLKRLDRIAPRGTVVTDAGSVKGFLARSFDQKKWQRIRFVGAHPLAGSHQRGIDAADPKLFDRALTFITPGRRHSKEALQGVKKFWQRISRRIAVVSPELHDALTAEVSHLPHLLAACLVASVSPQALPCAASGFLDTTRIVQADPRLWVPILLENRKELSLALSRFESYLARIKKAFRAGDRKALRKWLLQAQHRRMALE